MTQLRGQSEPAWSPNPLRIGTTIKMRTEGKPDVKLMVSAIVSKRDALSREIFVLLTAHSSMSKYSIGDQCYLVRSQGKRNEPLGKLVDPQKVLGGRAKELGFHLLEIDNAPLFPDQTETTHRVSTTKNFHDDIWSGGSFKVRRINDIARVLADRSSKGNRRPVYRNAKGRVCGDVYDVQISEQDGVYKFSYCGLVSRGRGRPLAETHSLGAPVISQSGALSAIIVGTAETETVVYPIEEILKSAPIEFLTFGDDWPKIRVID